MHLLNQINLQVFSPKRKKGNRKEIKRNRKIKRNMFWAVVSNFLNRLRQFGLSFWSPKHENTHRRQILKAFLCDGRFASQSIFFLPHTQNCIWSCTKLTNNMRMFVQFWCKELAQKRADPCITLSKSLEYEKRIIQFVLNKQSLRKNAPPWSFVTTSEAAIHKTICLNLRYSSSRQSCLRWQCPCHDGQFLVEWAYLRSDEEVKLPDSQHMENPWKALNSALMRKF